MVAPTPMATVALGTAQPLLDSALQPQPRAKVWRTLGERERERRKERERGGEGGEREGE
jgi:hypothetical protein